MNLVQMKKRIKNIDRRLGRIEQILPTLTTKAELQAAIEPLATKVELREEGDRTRRHMDIIAESLHDDIRLLAEAHGWVTGRLADHDARITRLEQDRNDR